MDQQSINYLNKLFKPVSILCLLLLSVNVFATTELVLPANHQSTYRITKFGTRVGEIKNELKQQEGIAAYTSVAVATGFASLFVKDDITESSVLSYPGGNDGGNVADSDGKSLQQQSYRISHGKKHKKNQQIAFNRTTESLINLHGTYGSKSYDVQTDKTVWARQLLPILMSSDLLRDENIRSNSFFITDKGSIQKYTYTFEKTESLIFDGKASSTLKFMISGEGSSSMSYVWLSKDYDYLPLKIDQYKDDKLNVSMSLTQFNVTP